MQYLSRTALISGEEGTVAGGAACGPSTRCRSLGTGAWDWTLDHATAIQPQVTSAKTAGRPFIFAPRARRYYIKIQAPRSKLQAPRSKLQDPSSKAEGTGA